MSLPVAYAVRGELNGRRTVLAANGPGPGLAGRAVEVVRKSETLEAIVSTGFCGALDSTLRVGDVFSASEIRWSGGSAAVRQPSATASFKSGPLLSVDRVAVTAEEKRKLARNGAQAIEMEAAGVIAQTGDVPFYCVRAVTDTAGEGFSIDFNLMRGPDGRFSRSKIIRAALRRPFTSIPELVRLDARSRNAARALGDFIAECQF